MSKKFSLILAVLMVQAGFPLSPGQISLLTLGGSATAIAADRSDLHDDPALRKAVEDHGRRFVEAVNSGDPTMRRRTAHALFVPSAFEGDGEAKPLRLFEWLRADLGKLQFRHAEARSVGESDTRRFSLHVFPKSG